MDGKVWSSELTVSICNAIILSCPDSEEVIPVDVGGTVTEWYGRTREMAAGGGKLWGPS